MKDKIGSFFTSISSLNLKRKLLLSFALMSVFPLLICVFLVSNYKLLPLPWFSIRVNITLVIAVGVCVAILGFWLVKRVFDRITSVSAKAKLIAEGDIDIKVPIIGKKIAGKIVDKIVNDDGKFENFLNDYLKSAG